MDMEQSTEIRSAAERNELREIVEILEQEE